MTVAYLAVDLETTGLDPREDSILEVAWAPLSPTFEQVEPTRHLVLEATDAARERLLGNDYVREMHRSSGLIQESLIGGLRLAVVEQVILATAEAWEWADGRLTVLGSSVHFDLRFLQAHMPALSKLLHYRVLDVTTLISFASAAGAWTDDWRIVAHRATADIDWSIAAAQRIFADFRRQGVPA